MCLSPPKAGKDTPKYITQATVNAEMQINNQQLLNGAWGAPLPVTKARESVFRSERILLSIDR